MSWSAAQYLAFETERTRPVRDLLCALPAIDVRTAIDLGCGPGNSTEVLAERFPLAEISGIDSSADMIDAAKRRLPGVRFTLADIADWHAPGSFDLLLANAVLQWLPDHATLLPSLLTKLSSGGVLAIQMPDNLDSPAHRLMRDVAAEGRWANKLAAVSAARTALAGERWYYELLRSVCTHVDIWRTTYYHVIKGGPCGVVSWFQGTGLRPFLQPLEQREREEYLARYTKALSGAYATLPDGSTLLPFPRLFIVAVA